MAMRESLSSGKPLPGRAALTGPQFSTVVAPLVSRMEKVVAYRASLQTLQGAWDMLSLLGQMSGIGAELGRTRESFQRLSETLLDNLANQQLEARLHGLRGRAQVAIDILVRNLFERTADVGFLATDAELREFSSAAADGDADEASCAALRSRFAAYVAKYSVYDDIVVLAPDGRVLLRLDTAVSADRSQHPFVAEAQRSGCAYVEHFGPLDVLDGRRGLVYAAAILGAGGRPIAVLCLSFRFEDEMRGIFARLLGVDDGVVLALLDTRGEVLVGSDHWQLPVGAELPQPRSGSAHRPLVRFAGREYLRAAAFSAGYQGYGGPGWQAVALLPVEFAFRDEIQSDAGAQDGELHEHATLARGLDTRHIFNAALRGIPLQAQQIQLDLARSVWNGKLKRGGDLGASAQAHDFAATFLHEVSRTGAQIRGVFDDAIAGLQTAVIAAILEEARFHASLAIDIMDRNLYERANDSRWWALTSTLRRALAEPEDARVRHAGEVLRHINSLYTVYSLLVLFDTRGQVVATSDPARAELIGQVLDADTVRGTLALRDAQDYHVGPHAPSPLYGGAPTYIFAAAVRAGSRADVRGVGPVVGGIAIVFDGQPQFAAMLADALPRGADGQVLAGAFGLFVDRKARVIASTDARFPVGSSAAFALALLAAPASGGGQQVVEIEGVCYAAGVAPSDGYREYTGQGTAQAPSEHDVSAVVLLRLGQPLPPAAPPMSEFEPAAAAPRRADAATLEIAAFVVGGQWFGLEAECVEEVLGKLPLTALANAASHCPGVIRHRDKVIPVLDMQALLRPGHKAGAGGQVGPDGPLLLCRIGTGQRVALRVDALGLVFTVAADQLKTWQSHAGAPVLRLLSGRSGASEAMLSVLSIDMLWPAAGQGGPASALFVPEAEQAQSA